MVRRQYRHVRHVLGRLQRPPGGGTKPPVPESDHPGPWHRRPVLGRYPLQGRLPPHRGIVLGNPLYPVHDAAAGPGDRPGGLAGHLAGAVPEGAHGAGDLDGASAEGRVLAPWFRVGRPCRHPVSRPGGLRLGGRVHRGGAAHGGTPECKEQGLDRALGPHLSASGDAGTPGRVPAGGGAMVGPVAEGAGQRRGGIAPGASLPAGQRAPGDQL